ncbi:MAG: ferric reductase-like transmembrane domain-containing protein [Actinomycetota bacterium]|nr:ferric reductase-like transmembrane domain-containing protein [Actinomycetota bacterium]
MVDARPSQTMTLRPESPGSAGASGRRKARRGGEKPGWVPASNRRGPQETGTPGQARPSVARPVLLPLAGLLVAGGGVWILVLSFTSVTGVTLHAPGGMMTLLGTATGLIGTYLALVMVVLASRIAPIERLLGLDGMLRWHRRLAPWPITLIVLHVVLTTIGYAEAASKGFGSEFGALVFDYPDVLAATVGFFLMCAIGVASYRAIRVRLRRETWWALHLYIYVALALSFAHALVIGPTFVGHPITRAIWIVLWLGALGLIVIYRLGIPLVRSMRMQLRVADVRKEAPGVVSVVLQGRNLHRLPVAGGQFALWRFITPGLWWQAHPYTLSALPHPPYLRITVKALGDHSTALAKIKRGTRVLFEGPYGVFTHETSDHSPVALIGAGIGVTSVRSLLEDLPKGTSPAVVLRASSDADTALHKEVADLVAHQKGTLHEILGNRGKVRLDGKALLRLVPDLRQRDVYVCGPEEFVGSMMSVCRGLGVPSSALHHEAYAL